MKLYNIEINIQSIRLLGMQLLLYDSKCSGMVVFLCQGRIQDFKRGGGWQTIFIEGW